MMLKLIFLVVLLECSLAQPQKVAPGVPPQKYQNNQAPPPPATQPPHQKLPPGVPPQKYQTQQKLQQQQQAQQQRNQQVPQQQVPQQQVPQQQVPQQQVPQQKVPQQQIPQQQVPQQPVHVQEPKLLSEDHMEHEKKHMEMHMEVPVDTADLTKEEMHFRYFKMHDIDKNDKLDGCELIKSLHHWHDEMDRQPPVYTDDQLEKVLEYALKNTDLNNDGEGEAPTEFAHVYSDEDLTEIVEGALKQADFNNDGFIDYAELKRSVMYSP